MLMSACQPTPVEEIVVNKADGGLQEIIQSSPAPTQEIEVEERWETELQKGNVYIHINAKVITPDVKAYPVLSIVPTIMNQEWADKAADLFFKDVTVYDRKITKQDIERKVLINKKVMERIKASDYSGGFSDRDYEYFEQRNVNLMDMFKTAPDETELVVSDKKLSVKLHGLISLELMGKIDQPNYAYLYVVNNELAKMNLIQFHNHSFIFGDYSTEYIKGDKPNGVLMTLEEAQKITDEKIDDMGITDVKLTDIKLANYLEVSPVFNDEEIESDNQAYEFVYKKTYNGINVSYFDSRMIIRQTENDPEPDPYNAHLRPEKLRVMVNDSGIVFFDWKDPTTSNGIISENVKLLDFERIKEIFTNQIFYHHFYDDPEGSLDINIDKVVLSYFIQPVKDNNDKYIAIPVWDFVRSSDYNGMEGTYLTINAIDGSVINRDLGY